jgi:A/G-specific adenine glycosylase
MTMPWPDSAHLLAPLAPWFDRTRRRLPWRADQLDGPHPDPYAVLVSELMLQQTQVATVVPYFTRWMERFPTTAALAQAEDDTVHKAWEGLGYYRRARFLKGAAEAVAAQGWPRDLEGLMRLPGLGPYTAAAVGAIAFQWATPALDGNAFRVLARLLLLEGDPRTEAEVLRAWLTPALQAHGPSRLTQALMELGATHCLPTPSCGQCPLADRCLARSHQRTAEIPPAAKRAQPKAEALWLLAVRAEGQLLLQVPAAKGLLAGLWRWPTVPIPDAPAFAGSHLLRAATAWPSWTQVYTHRREQVNPLELLLDTCFPPAEGHRWIPEAMLPGLPLGRRDQRLRDLLGSPGAAPLGAPDLQALLGALWAPGQHPGPGAYKA